MNDATPVVPHDDGDAFRYEKPDWMAAEKWAEIRAAFITHFNGQISEILGRCVEYDWCTNAGRPDHDEFHCSDTVDLIPSTRDDAEVAAVGAWVVKDRDGRTQARLVIDGDGELNGERFELELAHSDALAMLCVFARSEACDRLWDLVKMSARRDVGGGPVSADGGGQ
jgi:hypothetical protein